LLGARRSRTRICTPSWEVSICRGPTEVIIPETVRDLGTFGLDFMIPAHCTGWRGLNALERAYGEKVWSSRQPWGSSSHCEFHHEFIPMATYRWPSAHD
jgi:hypothetical protein